MCRTSWALMIYREIITAGIVPSVEVFSQVLGCLQLPRDTHVRNRLVENLVVSSNSSRRSNLCSLLDGFGEYDPRSFSLLEVSEQLNKQFNSFIVYLFATLIIEVNWLLLDLRRLLHLESFNVCPLKKVPSLLMQGSYRFRLLRWACINSESKDK